MDSRRTLHTNETFLNLLTASFEAGEKVYLLVDDEGISRKEGLIATVNTDELEPSILLEDGIVIPMHKLVAVNGVFRPEYGEC